MPLVSGCIIVLFPFNSPCVRHQWARLILFVCFFVYRLLWALATGALFCASFYFVYPWLGSRSHISAEFALCLFVNLEDCVEALQRNLVGIILRRTADAFARLNIANGNLLSGGHIVHPSGGHQLTRTVKSSWYNPYICNSVLNYSLIGSCSTWFTRIILPI